MMADVVQEAAVMADNTVQVSEPVLRLPLGMRIGVLIAAADEIAMLQLLLLWLIFKYK